MKTAFDELILSDVSKAVSELISDVENVAMKSGSTLKPGSEVENIKLFGELDDNDKATTSTENAFSPNQVGWYF